MEMNVLVLAEEQEPDKFSINNDYHASLKLKCKIQFFVLLKVKALKYFIVC